MQTPAILVIDDEQATLDMFKLFLSAYGYQVLTATDGHSGLDTFLRHKPDIVLTDIKMPRMDGIEVLTRIKQASPLTEVVVITGHGDIDLAIKALNLDATDFIHKPISKDSLDAALERVRERLELARAGNDEVLLGREAGCLTMDIRGNITTRSEAALQQAFERVRDEPGGLLLRFSDSASINGAGLAILKELLAKRSQNKQPAAMVGLSDNFQQVFTTMGIAELAPVYQSQDEALAALQQA